MNQLFGIDVSKWDANPVNWGAANMRYHLVKVSEGTVIDPLFNAHWNAARGHTLRGAYHFFRPFVDPKLSAQKTAEHLAGDYGELPLALDIETTDGRTDTLARAKVWKDEFERITGRKIMIYSRVEFMKSIGITASTTWLKGVAFWVAQYPFDKITTTWTLAQRTQRLHDMVTGEYTMDMPGIDILPPLKAQIWQWTARGNPADVPGYYLGWDGKKEVDFNFARPEWIDSFGYIPPTDEENEMAATYNCKARHDAKVRIHPNTNNITNPSVGLILKDQTFQISAIVPDNSDPGNTAKKWGVIEGGQFHGKHTALEYPGNDNPISTYTPIPGTTPPPAGELPPFDLNIHWDGTKYNATFNDKPVNLP
jgi:hypothetical protein